MVLADRTDHGGFQAKSREFIDCVRTGTQPASAKLDVVKTMEIADRILAAATLEQSSTGR